MRFIFLLSLVPAVSSALIPDSEFTKPSARQSTPSAPVVDLEYGIYEGYYNATSQLNIFKGIRYAAPPIGKLRWQRPTPPAVNRSQIFSAKTYPPKCPQAPMAPLPQTFNFTRSGLGSEDCLFLSVFQPQNATKLPVLVWIHGGGYGTGQGNNDISELIMTNSHGFIVVGIQYRLGAFGFLSSPEIARFGVPNAGLYDMNFALEWVQQYIGKFGGDPRRVTISGESAGAGAAMLQAMAFGGTQGTKLFNNVIVASPYLPMQWDYDGLEPVNAYQSFVEAVGCSKGSSSAISRTVFECLQGQDSVVLQNASTSITGSGKYGQWTFLPVTDGKFLKQRPSEQLLTGEVNGVRILSGHNADEGPGFVPQNVETSAEFDQYVESLFPLMNSKSRSSLEKTYEIAPTVPGPLFSTLGNTGPTALNQSEFGIGQQQRANNLYAETTFVCPSYWLATAYGPNRSKRGESKKRAWKYQYSVPPSEHGADLDAYYAINREALGYGTLSTAFRVAVQLIWGRFIIFNDPTLPPSIIKTITTLPNGTAAGDDLAAAGSGKWPNWHGGSGDSRDAYRMLNLNMTGGDETKILWTSAGGQSINVTQYAGPGLMANLHIVNAWNWEGGRGRRCEFLAGVGRLIPE